MSRIAEHARDRHRIGNSAVNNICDICFFRVNNLFFEFSVEKVSLSALVHCHKVVTLVGNCTCAFKLILGIESVVLNHI